MVEFSMKLGSRVNDKLAEYQMKKSKKILKNLSLVFIFLSAIFAIMSLANGLSDETDITIFGIAIFFIIFWVCFPPVALKSVKKQQEKNGTLTIMTEATEDVYKFDEEKVFIFTTLGDKYRSAIETVYGYFLKVVEDDDSYILFISNVQCHVIFKDCLTKGTLEEFESYLAKNFSGQNYIKNITANSQENPK